MYREKNPIIYIGFSTICSYRHSLGGLGTYPLWIRAVGGGASTASLVYFRSSIMLDFKATGMNKARSLILLHTSERQIIACAVHWDDSVLWEHRGRREGQQGFLEEGTLDLSLAGQVDIYQT